MSDAIYIQNVHFSYGQNKILKNFCSRVKYGQIYALLGPSGGGKTTLLKLILGRIKQQRGELRVLGLPPGEANSGISFMPQELGLCPNFSINQTLNYFKLVYNISDEEFFLRRKILTKLTNLPNGDLLVRQLSGGTQRRLSICVSLINNPQLVILDEPTVGIDAVLRNEIWNYLVGRVAEGMTIVIVTHYIEEAANAGRVGLMRNGCLLAEDNPQRLMSMYNEPNLEAVFLKLCCIEDQGYYCNTEVQYEKKSLSKNDQSFYPPSSNDITNNDIFTISKFKKSESYSESESTLSYSLSKFILFNRKLFMLKLWILISLIQKNLVKFFYSYFSLFIVFLPASQALIYCLATSKDLVTLKTAVYNPEVEPGYGKAFLDEIQPFRNFLIKPKLYQSLDEAKRAIDRDKVVGAIWIPENYTQSIEERIDLGFAAENSTIEASTIHAFIDHSLYIYSIEFMNSLLETFRRFTKKNFQTHDTNMIVDLPVHIEITEQSKRYRFQDYFRPAYFLLFFYISQTTMSSLALTQERKDGLFERSLVAGVSHELVFFSHIFTNILISLIQLVLLDFTSSILFNNLDQSNYWLKFSFFMLESLNAMSLGFVISSLIDEEFSCIILSWFLNMPQIFSTGVLWPLESLDKPFNYLFYLCPLSVPVQTIRQIVLQGWDLSNQQVQYGFLSSGIPMIFFFYAALIIFRNK